MKKQWWHDKVAYQIYPKSFCDSNSDGIGDINGIISKLDYLKSLGVDIVWISPMYKSPFVDQGYDISDYYAIDEKFGTMEDFENLLAEAKKRDMYILMDLVVNHCSDEHEWFKKAVADPHGKYGDYFYLREGKDGKEPSNYRGYFGGNTWDKVPGEDNLYYFHAFHKRQPDLNWENPELREEIYKMMNWWLDKGLRGFRIDAIINIKKNTLFPTYEPDGEDGLVRVTRNVEDAGGINDFLREMKEKTFAPHNAFTVGEVFNLKKEDMVAFVGEDGHFSTMFDFTGEILDTGHRDWTDTSRIDFTEWRDLTFKSQAEMQDIGFLANIVENHDEPRGASRYLPEYACNDDGKKMLATAYMMLRGIPFIYQGQEIGMVNCPRENISCYDDIASHDRYNKAIRRGFTPEQALEACHRHSRDNARTPVHWDDSKNAGFSDGTPWAPVDTDYKEINVANQEKDENSVLSYYKKLIALRKSPNYSERIVYGETIPVFTEEKMLFGYERKCETDTILVLCNFADKDITLDLTKLKKKYTKVLLSNKPVEIGDKLVLTPAEALILD